MNLSTLNIRVYPSIEAKWTSLSRRSNLIYRRFEAAFGFDSLKSVFIATFFCVALYEHAFASDQTIFFACIGVVCGCLAATLVRRLVFYTFYKLYLDELDKRDLY